MRSIVIISSIFAACLLGQGCKTSKTSTGSDIKSIEKVIVYEDSRPAAAYRLDTRDSSVVLRHGQGPDSCDYLGARDVWVWEDKGVYYMHYDGAGKKGWLACLATSKDLTSWEAKGAALDFGAPDSKDCASASYGTTYYDGSMWHMFYLGTPHVTPKPDFVPAFPYLTMKAEGNSPAGPWKKRYDITPFSPQTGTYYDATASPGQIIKQGNDYLMFFSASTGYPKVLRTIGIARTKNLDSAWTIDPNPILPQEEQIENTTLYFEKSNQTWFLFTNHIGIKDTLEYTDAIWVYWSKDLNNWDPSHKAIVLDPENCTWSKHIIGLPSVVQHGDRLALFYDGNGDAVMPTGVKSHMNRDIGVAWIDLPINLPEK